ncbi:MAG: 4-(cytidine 5'-diphospho)-2-C-methyl-D-erythritol kinase [Rudaea sp.]
MKRAAWIDWPAPAKLNLFLHIVGRRADGYHLLQTLFQLLDWGDTLHLRLREDGEIRRASALPGVDPEEDLCMRAARLLRAASGRALGVDIRVDKHVPIGGGLGGGSSDAASVLVALNEMWKVRLEADELARLGLQLGADVPVFVRGHSAWAEGIGELLTPVTLPERHFVIVDPQVRVPTAALFQAPQLTRNSPPATISGYLAGIRAGNVFTPVVRARYPEVAAALDWLDQFGEARLTGSGGCAFVAADSREAAESIVHSCPVAFVAFAARGVSASPLQEAAAAYRRLCA